MPRTLSLTLAALLLAALAVCVGCGGPAYPPSDHFEGGRFYNNPRVGYPGFFGFLKWRLTRDPGAWSPKQEARGRFTPPPERSEAPRITFIGHSTALLQMQGLNILMDPIWAERASPLETAGPLRLRPPGIPFEALPPIDVVLISHDHYDHLCIETLERLHARDAPKFVVGLGVAEVLADYDIPGAIELDWWEEIALAPDLQLTFTPAQHGSGRGLTTLHETLWGGFYLRGAARIFFAGDTGLGPHFAAIRARLGAPDLALLPIGAYLPRWFMRAQHMSPGDAVEAHQILGARHSLAIHSGTFPLADEGEGRAVEDLDAALKAAGLGREDFWVLGLGEGRDLPSRERHAHADIKRGG